MNQQASVRFLTDLPEEKMKNELLQAFTARYGTSNEEIICIASPARINIIGEHIDYNGGKVFPAAIDRYLYVILRKRADSKIIYDDIRFPGAMEFSIADTFTYRKESQYANYLNGMLSILQKKGCVLNTGFEVLFFSKLPAGGGISSSAALEIGFGRAVAELFGFHIDAVDLAKMGQESEHTFMNVQCGIMDQFSVAMGKKEYAILLDTSTLEYHYVPLVLGDYRIVVMNTNKQRLLADSKYNERRAECMEGLALLQKVKPIANLCELHSTDMPLVTKTIHDERILKRVRHCISENERVQEAVAALQATNLVQLGSLLKASHASLRDDYEVTGCELDTLADAANAHPCCLGARMTGAGFGGCAIAIVQKDAVAEFTARVGEQYSAATGLTASFFACEAGDGAGRI
ncbi:MAG: galactokinase [Treponema sp.]|uniref:galactokinase n=1 Tax=Treponema sp. TaxID=166 RepID=UPI003FA1FF79